MSIVLFLLRSSTLKVVISNSTLLVVRYTCYRRQQNFTAWSYFAGASNTGIIAEVGGMRWYCVVKCGVSGVVVLCGEVWSGVVLLCGMWWDTMVLYDGKAKECLRISIV